MQTIILSLFFLVIDVTLPYEMRCPFVGQWRLRARLFYCGRSYVCLLSSPGNVYRETCDGLDYSSTGSKLIFQPYFNKAECSNRRYQPFPFSTEGNSKCVYQKSLCNEEGQIVYHKGSLINDTTCGCDFLKGYIFVTNPIHNCYCIPSEEDCSCVKMSCYYTDIECQYMYNYADLNNQSCQDILTRTSSETHNSSLIKERKHDKSHDNKGKNYRLLCIYITIALIIVIVIGLPLFSVSVWPESFYKQKNVLYYLKSGHVLTVEDIKGIHQYSLPEDKKRKLMEILLYGDTDKYNRFIKALIASGTYKDLADQITNTTITPEDRCTFQDCCMNTEYKM